MRMEILANPGQQPEVARQLGFPLLRPQRVQEAKRLMYHHLYLESISEQDE